MPTVSLHLFGSEVMAKPGFLELKVYRQAERLSDLVSKIVVKWDPFHRNTVGERLVRAADSVGANIAQGFGLRAFRITAATACAHPCTKRTTGCGVPSAGSSFNRNTSARSSRSLTSSRRCSRRT